MSNRRVILIIVCGIIYFAITFVPLNGQGVESEYFQGAQPDIRFQEVFFYFLGPEDVIKITVWGHPELSGELTVAPDGIISLPLTGDTIKVDGLTREEVTAELIRVMDRYIKHPRVTVNIVAYNSKVYYVLGEVGQPGKFSMEKTIVTLRDALIKAGLPTNSAALGSVHIITPHPEKPTYTVVNASKLLYRGKLKNNIVLKAGDVVYVPRNVFDKTTDILNKILGPVRAASAARSDIRSW
jgi:polysaccharide export outer membrane protein